MSLIDHLKQVRDYRTQPRYPLWAVLVLVILGTMSGAVGYRGLGEFVERHQAVLLELMELPHHRLPSYSTIRHVMTRIDFASLTTAFNAWAAEQFSLQPGEHLAIDGKSIKVSLEAYDSRYQDFVNVVSAFCVRQGVVVGLVAMHTQDGSEIDTVRTLLATLKLRKVCFSLDALHTQKNG